MAVRVMGFLYNVCFSLGLGWLGYRLSFAYLELPAWEALGPAEPAVRAAYHTAFSILGFLVGFILAGILFRQVVALGANLGRVPAQDKVAGVVGIIIGLTLTALLSILLKNIPAPYGPLFILLVAIPCIYLGATIAMSMKEEVFYFFPGLSGARSQGAEVPLRTQPKLLDTNVIIDGRIADICRSGFIEGPVYVPGFVLDELHLIADSPDTLKRNRGRRGLDILNQMQTEPNMLVEVLDDYDEAPLDPGEGVDQKLVKLAKHMEASIVTNDFNLNKVAQLQGVTVLNINELANAVKPVVLPGEEMTVTIVKEGKEPMQGVAYLDDGTMVVVQQGKEHIGQTLYVVVTSVIQTLAGRMIFADVKALARSEETHADKNVRSDTGGGERRKARSPYGKAFAPLCGRPLLAYALEAFREATGVDEIVVAVRPQEMEAARELLARGPAERTEKAVTGGAARAESVWAALQEASPDTEIVLIHDAARPLVSQQLIERCLQAARRTGAALAALPASDTVKRSREGRLVADTLDRERVWLAQTPQAFRYGIILEAYQRALHEGFRPSDDAAAVERLGRRVELVEGERDNIKITYPDDLAAAEALLRARRGAAAGPRCGIGHDVHRLVEGRRLVLGGVEFPGPLGLAGHSDADVLCHAVADAVLGAAGLGDIGRHFPDTDPEYAGASSLELLGRVAALVAGGGLEVVHVDAVVVAEEPKVAPAAERMCAAMAQALGLAAAQVSVKGTTTEGLGWAGRREGIAAYAVCVVAPATTN